MARTTSRESHDYAPRPAGRGRVGVAKTPGLGARKPPQRALPTTLKTAKTGKPPAWSKFTPVTLKSSATADDAIYVVVSACRDHWQRNLAAAVDGRDPEGLHQARVGLRRLRSALAAFKKFISAPQRSALNQEAKWLLAQLCPARDLDVLIGDLAAPLAGGLSADAGLAQLMRAARLAQTKAHGAAAKALEGARALRFVSRLDAWLSGRGWRTGKDASDDGLNLPAADFARRLLNRRLRNIRADYSDLHAATVEERHELRLDVKKARYALEFFQVLLPAKRVARVNGLLKALQENLGHLNDIEVAQRTVAELVHTADAGLARRQIAAGGEVIGQWHKAAAAKAEPEMFDLWRKFKKAPLL